MSSVMYMKRKLYYNYLSILSVYLFMNLLKTKSCVYRKLCNNINDTDIKNVTNYVYIFWTHHNEMIDGKNKIAEMNRRNKLTWVTFEK